MIVFHSAFFLNYENPKGRKSVFFEFEIKIMPLLMIFNLQSPLHQQFSDSRLILQLTAS